MGGDSFKARLSAHSGPVFDLCEVDDHSNLVEVRRLEHDVVHCDCSQERGGWIVFVSAWGCVRQATCAPQRVSCDDSGCPAGAEVQAPRQATVPNSNAKPNMATCACCSREDHEGIQRPLDMRRGGSHVLLTKRPSAFARFAVHAPNMTQFLPLFARVGMSPVLDAWSGM